MLEVRRNAWLLAKIKSLGGKKMLDVDLDIQDYLNPQQTIDRYMLGVDMQFMVERCGGTQETEIDIQSSENLFTEIAESADDQKLLELLESVDVELQVN
jgi:hypothetical protein